MVKISRSGPRRTASRARRRTITALAGAALAATCTLTDTPGQTARQPSAAPRKICHP